eukprot:5720192-Alexandrium_andersonii.AAC.1
MLDCVLAAHAHAIARRPVGVKASRKIRVDVRADGHAITLPRKMVNASRALDEVSGKAHKRRRSDLVGADTRRQHSLAENL